MISDTAEVNFERWGIHVYRYRYIYIWKTFGIILVSRNFGDKKTFRSKHTKCQDLFIKPESIGPSKRQCPGTIKTKSWFNVDTASINCITVAKQYNIWTKGCGKNMLYFH